MRDSVKIAVKYCDIVVCTCFNSSWNLAFGRLDLYWGTVPELNLELFYVCKYFFIAGKTADIAIFRAFPVVMIIYFPGLSLREFRRVDTYWEIA